MVMKFTRWLTCEKWLHVSTFLSVVKKTSAWPLWCWQHSCLPLGACLQRVQQTRHLSVQDHTVTDNIITLSPCCPFLTVTKKLYYGKFIFPPRAVCCQIAGKLKWLARSRKHQKSFSSSVTTAAVTSGIKPEQEDYMAAYYWLSFLIIIMSVSDPDPSYRLIPHRWLHWVRIIDIFVLQG